MIEWKAFHCKRERSKVRVGSDLTEAYGHGQYQIKESKFFTALRRKR